ncbi:MAG: sodium:solute symporter [Exilibacterium sp.]
MVEAKLHLLDLTIIACYFCFIVAVGIYTSRKHTGAEDYFLAGRKMIWPVIGLSLIASNISSTTFVGLAGEAYNTGLSVFNYEWMASVVLAFYAIFLLPFVLRAQVFTMPEYLQKRFDNRARLYFSGLTLFLNIIVDTAGSLYAGALIVRMIYPEVPIWMIIAGIAAIASVYTIAGGLVAVMITDSVQAILLFTGATVIAVSAFSQVGSWEAVTAQVDAGMLSLVRPLDHPGVPWLGLVTGVPLLGFYFWCTNQFMAQRVLAAKSVDHGRWGSLFAGLLKLPILFIMVLPGTMALLLYPDLERPDLVFPTLMFDLLPTGLLGLVLAGFLAALMGQLTSTVNSASTLATMDFVRRVKPDLSSQQLMLVGRITTGLFMLLAVAWAPQIEKFPSLFQYLQAILSYTVPPVVAMFIVGIFWKRATAQGAFITLVIGIGMGMVLFLLNEVFNVIYLHFLYVAPILFALCSVVLIVASLFTEPADEVEVAPFTWTRVHFRAETEALRLLPWYQNYRVLSLLLLAITGLLVVKFW